jgi:hypothetical protein
VNSRPVTVSGFAFSSKEKIDLGSMFFPALVVAALTIDAMQTWFN